MEAGTDSLRMVQPNANRYRQTVSQADGRTDKETDRHADGLSVVDGAYMMTPCVRRRSVKHLHLL